MTIQLPADLEARINLRLQGISGITASDVLRKALDALDSHDDEIAAIQEGLDDLGNGRVISALSALKELKKLSPINSGGQRFTRDQLHERG